MARIGDGYDVANGLDTGGMTCFLLMLIKIPSHYVPTPDPNKDNKSTRTIQHLQTKHKITITHITQY